MHDKIRPPLKWAGGKYRILHHIKAKLPDHQHRLIEPFVGSGALFLNTDFQYYTLNDQNPDLIAFYRQLQSDGDGFIAYCKGFFIPKYNHADRYYHLRATFNSTDDVLLKAALFLYLNRHGYNGLCRYNACGQFNVPFGRNVKPYFPELQLRFFAKKSENVTFTCEDFENIMSHASFQDVIYCDPPYIPRSRTSNFVSYKAGGFDQKAQIRLATAAYEAAGRGATALISNHGNRQARAIYRQASKFHYFNVRRSISCNSDKRERAKELIAVYPPQKPSI